MNYFSSRTACGYDSNYRPSAERTVSPPPLLPRRPPPPLKKVVYKHTLLTKNKLEIIHIFTNAYNDEKINNNNS